jgi:succinate dehydrogenase / fumarate reductase flavoprotein subunit/L-aspartate oxidase
VAVVGAGAAGLMAACVAAPNADTLLLTDRALGACNSAMAQGGLQLPYATGASRESFVADIMRSARVPVDEVLVRQFVDTVSGCVEELEGWGLELDRDESGTLVRVRAGGLSEARIVSSGDSIGVALARVLRDRTESLGVAVETHATVERVDPEDGFVKISVRERDGSVRMLRARSVVAATGGVTYRRARDRHEATTNPQNENHVLYDALCDLGLERIHEDFFQYQPFGIVSVGSGAVGRCVPESIVNYRVRLLDRHGETVCDLSRDRLEVGDAMRDAMARGDAYPAADAGLGLLLTLSDVDPDELRTHFPKLVAHLDRQGLLGSDVLVRPFLHYQLGGFRTGLDGRTNVPGLFLAGEMTGGLHGRNRLMGNGITDSLVRGRMAGAAASAFARSR